MKNIIYKKSVSSTNTEITQYKNLLDEFDFVALYSDEQTKGRGRKNRFWESINNENIYLSIMCNKQIKNLNMITIASGLSVCEALEEKFDLDFKIKWPNDIYIKNKKLAGILVESSFLGNSLDYFIIGIGINLNNKSFSSVNNIATSIYLETKKFVNRDDLINIIIKKVLENINKLDANNFSISNYEKRLNHLHKEVYLGSEQVLTKGVDNNGNLIIEKSNGVVETLSFEEISIKNTN